MPANKKPAPKAPAKPVKKAAKPAVKKPVKAAAKPAPKPKAQAGKAAKPAPKKTSPVKKAPAKKAAPVKKAAPAKKPAPKKAAPPAKPVKKVPARTAPAPAVKKAAPPAKKAPAPAAKKAAPAPKPAPAPAPVKAAPKASPAPAPAKKAAPAPAAKAVPAAKSSAGKAPVVNKRAPSALEEGITLDSPPKKPVLPAAFLKKQKQRLIELRDIYLNAAEGVTNENLRNNDSSESAFGMHQADAGSDAYDRDFALSLLAKEQDAIYEINEALKRIEQGTYGICEMSGELIPEERLEALPFTRFTVGSQAKIENEQRGGRWTRPVRSLFGLDESADDDDDDDEEDDTAAGKSKQSANESLDFSKE
ncbi:MAG: RNA polymerase-binding transcription factor DksA [Prosthecobacter sp.]|nr:RNA polymerase-binding transcription factor DksA [Prosthecobacter sp.]